MRALERADIDAAYEHFARIAIEIINNDDEAHPQVFVVRMDDNKPGVLTGMGSLDPRLVEQMQRTPQGKDMMTWVIKTMLCDEEVRSVAPMRPDLAVHVTEVWGVHLEKGTTFEQAQKQPPPSEHPDRVEGLMVCVHHPEKTYSGFMPITKVNGRRHVEFTPIDYREFFSGPMTMNGEDAPPMEQ